MAIWKASPFSNEKVVVGMGLFFMRAPNSTFRAASQAIDNARSGPLFPSRVSGIPDTLSGLPDTSRFRCPYSRREASARRETGRQILRWPDAPTPHPFRNQLRHACVHHLLFLVGVVVISEEVTQAVRP